MDKAQKQKEKEKGIMVHNNVFHDARLNIELPPPRPLKLQVSFPLLDGPWRIKQSKLNKLLNKLKKMSDKEFTFVFRNNAEFLEIEYD